jgi:hypothetical protein
MRYKMERLFITCCLQSRSEIFESLPVFTRGIRRKILTFAVRRDGESSKPLKLRVTGIEWEEDSENRIRIRCHTECRVTYYVAFYDLKSKEGRLVEVDRGLTIEQTVRSRLEKAMEEGLDVKITFCPVTERDMPHLKDLGVLSGIRPSESKSLRDLTADTSSLGDVRISSIDSVELIRAE